MTHAPSKFGFVECADMVSAQKYSAALIQYQQAVSNFRDSKTTPKRSEIARQLFQIGAALEEALKSAFGAQWDSQVPQFAEENKLLCSFCGKTQNEVRKLIAGHSMHICDECVGACNEILTQENIDTVDDVASSSAESSAERLCGICMEPRDSDELIFLPHAAYMCAACLEEIQQVRDKRGE